jgi:nitrate reductase / nitrite oxidoreductase, alpha subunit
VEDVIWQEMAAEGKLDLVVDLNFRMDTSALYSDVILPSASWYEKDDLNSTDLHSFIHPLQKAVPPCWESKSDWQIFRELARHTQEIAAKWMPEPVDDLVLTPLLHDTPARDRAAGGQGAGRSGECEPLPGKHHAERRDREARLRESLQSIHFSGAEVPRHGTRRITERSTPWTTSTTNG